MQTTELREVLLLSLAVPHRAEAPSAAKVGNPCGAALALAAPLSQTTTPVRAREHVASPLVRQIDLLLKIIVFFLCMSLLFSWFVQFVNAVNFQELPNDAWDTFFSL